MKDLCPVKCILGMRIERERENPISFTYLKINPLRKYFVSSRWTKQGK
jgi:hypothetical protein